MITVEKSSDTDNVVLDFYDPYSHRSRVVKLNHNEYDALIGTLKTYGTVPDVVFSDLAEDITWTDEDDRQVESLTNDELVRLRDELRLTEDRLLDSQDDAAKWEGRYADLVDRYFELVDRVIESGL